MKMCNRGAEKCFAAKKFVSQTSQAIPSKHVSSAKLILILSLSFFSILLFSWFGKKRYKNLLNAHLPLAIQSDLHCELLLHLHIYKLAHILDLYEAAS